MVGFLSTGSVWKTDLDLGQAGLTAGVALPAGLLGILSAEEQAEFAQIPLGLGLDGDAVGLCWAGLVITGPTAKSGRKFIKALQALGTGKLLGLAAGTQGTVGVGAGRLSAACEADRQPQQGQGPQAPTKA